MFFKKFFDTFRELHINLPLLDILQGMTKYAKYSRDVVEYRFKLHDAETVALTDECSFVVTQKIPKKLKDPGKFTLSIQISNNEVVQELSDLGASINLIPLSLFNI